MGTNAPIVASNLRWSSGEQEIVGPIDLTVSAGELVVIIGPNGAGKTSLVRLLSGLVPPTQGDIRWFDHDSRSLDRRSRARRLVYLPQLSPLSIPLTVEEFVSLGRYPHRDRWTLAANADDEQVVSQALDRLELNTLRDRPMAELSGGERQRASLAAALAQGGSVWLLDEPTTYLDPRHQLEILSLLQAIHREGRTLVITTHDLNLAARLATRVIALDGGQIQADGSPCDVLSGTSLRRLFAAHFEVETVDGGLRIWLTHPSTGPQADE